MSMQQHPSRAVRACLALLLTGSLSCADRSEADPAPSRGSNGEAHSSSVRSPEELTAADVMDRALIALGGSDAEARLQVGHAIFTFEKAGFAGWAEHMGDGPVTLEVWYDLRRKKEKRAIKSSDGREAWIITDGDRLWTGTPDGKGRLQRSPPQEVYRGAFILGTFNSIKFFQDAADKLTLDTSELESNGYYVVDAYVGEGWAGTLLIDRATWHVLLNEKQGVPFNGGRGGDTALLTTVFGPYQMFDGVPLPTWVSVDQDEITLLECTLDHAEFPSSVDEAHFQIPE